MLGKFRPKTTAKSAHTGGKSLLSNKLVLNKRNGLIFIAMFAVVGASLLVISRAATSPVAFEAESGVLTGGATSVANANASGGRALAFAGAATPAPTPVPTSPPIGSAQWLGDYSTGNFLQWPNREYKEGGTAADLARQQQIVTSPARSGFRYTARFEVEAGDMTSGDPSRNRSEVADYADVSKLNGGTSWWAWSMYLPAGFHVDTDAESPVGNGWMLCTQWHGVNDLNLVFGLTKGAGPHLEIGTMTKGTARSSDWVSPAALPLGQWVDFVVGVTWSNTAGHLTVKMNKATVVNINTPTLESGANGMTYFKQGVYRARSNQAQAVYYTGTRRGPTEASVTY